MDLSIGGSSNSSVLEQLAAEHDHENGDSGGGPGAAVVANVITLQLVGKRHEQTAGLGYYACVWKKSIATEYPCIHSPVGRLLNIVENMIPAGPTVVARSHGDQQ